MNPPAVVFPLVLILVHSISDGVLSFNLEPTIPVIKQGNRSSYFGFSVAQHADSSGSLWILVGAPLGQNLQPGTNRSGALFKCPISGWANDCEQVVTDGKRVTDSEQIFPPTPDELKDEQWLGVNVRSQRAGRKVMVCAHRYVHQGRDFRWGNGLCHFLNKDLQYDRSLDPCRGKEQHGLEGYGFCQVGTSAAILDDDTALLGAPGAVTARGTMFGISVSDDFLMRDRTQYKSPFDSLDKYSYLGMAVEGGKFFDDTYSYVSGAPKAANFSGQVIFFEKEDGQEYLRMRTAITGEGFASSYGYELATLDLNGDGRPDLVVGAPFYVDNRGAGGAAYIYLNPEGGFRENTPFIRLTGPSESRFGYAISSIGDLNKDGFEDLAVGAPYADDGSGRVYVFLGHTDGIIREPSQVIRASESFPQIRTFGFSLSGGMDLDDNTYPDLVVGAYESDAAVLLRSRPIIGIKTEVYGNLTDIDPNSAGCRDDPDSEDVCFSFKACFRIQEMSRVLSASLYIESRIEAETFVEGKKFSRVRFRNGRPDREQVVIHRVNVKQNEPHNCSTEVVYLKKNVRDIQSPIAFKLTYTLIQNAPRYVPNRDAIPNIQNYPILNQQEASKVFVARFAKDCGDNDICESDVSVRAWTDLPLDDVGNYQIILGERTEIIINVDVENFGEPAYEANLYIRHPKSMPFGGRITNTSADSVLCSPASNDVNLVACSLGNPYPGGDRSRVALRLRFGSNLKDIEAHLSFEVWVNSTSLETDAGNNRQQINATVIKKAELAIYGRSEPSNVYYGGKITGESAIRNYSEIGPRIVHEFTVLNSGPWKATHFKVIIWWPHQVENKRPQGKWLLYPESNPMVEGDVVCNVPPDSIDVLRLRTKRSVTSEDAEDEWVVASQTERSADGRTKTYVEMNCVRGTAKCLKIECDVKNLLSRESAVIKIHSRLWNGTLLEDYSQVDEVRIRSRAQIRILDDNRQDPVDDEANVLTTCVPDLKLKVDLEGIAWWIYALSIVAGILLLLLIVYCLHRSGFFKRRRPEPTHTASIVKS